MGATRYDAPMTDTRQAPGVAVLDGRIAEREPGVLYRNRARDAAGLTDGLLAGVTLVQGTAATAAAASAGTLAVAADGNTGGGRGRGGGELCRGGCCSGVCSGGGGVSGARASRASNV